MTLVVMEWNALRLLISWCFGSCSRFEFECGLYGRISVCFCPFFCGLQYLIYLVLVDSMCMLDAYFIIFLKSDRDY